MTPIEYIIWLKFNMADREHVALFKHESISINYQGVDLKKNDQAISYLKTHM